MKQRQVLSMILALIMVLSVSIFPSAAEGTGFVAKSAYESEILAHAAEILAGDYQGSLSIDGLSTTQIPLVETNTFNENLRTPGNGIWYYIPIIETGNMLTYTNTVLCATGYVKNWEAQEWWFADAYAESGAYTVHPNGDPSICLTVDPYSNSVYIGSYTEGDSNQYWKIDLQSGGHYLTSKSSNADVRNKRIVVTPTNLSVSTSGTPMFFLEAGHWVPTNSIACSNVMTSLGENQALTLSFYGEKPENAPAADPLPVATGNAPALLTYTILSPAPTDPQAFKIVNNVVMPKYVCWEKTVKIQHKVTGTEAYFNVTVCPPSNKLGVPFYEQETNYWCWAACAQMVGMYINPSCTYDQVAIVREVKCDGEEDPTPWEAAGSLEETITALEYVANDDTIEFISTNSALSWETICDSIYNEKPINMIIGYYNSNGIRNGGHQVVIVGCEYDANGIPYVFYFDPALKDSANDPIPKEYSLLVNGYPSGDHINRYVQTIYY